MLFKFQVHPVHNMVVPGVTVERIEEEEETITKTRIRNIKNAKYLKSSVHLYFLLLLKTRNLVKHKNHLGEADVSSIHNLCLEKKNKAISSGKHVRVTYTPLYPTFI